ncbi:MAG: hypothetical protein GXP44_00445 [bacterium]|nr:hypothetical protein [bacterium]
MSNISAEQFRELYKKLPEDLRGAISSADSGEALRDIAKKHGLAVDKSGELADETGSVMLGVTAPKDFVRNLERRLEVDGKTAREIAAEVNERIFAKVRESLKKIHGIGSPEKGEVSATEEKKAEEPKPFAAEEKMREEPAPPEVSGGEEEPKEKIPDILKGSTEPEPIPEEKFAKVPFEAKTGEGVFRMPLEESKYEEPEKSSDQRYPGGDPYREPVK